MMSKATKKKMKRLKKMTTDPIASYKPTRKVQNKDEDPFNVEVKLEHAFNPDCIYVSKVDDNEKHLTMRENLRKFYDARTGVMEKWEVGTNCVVFSRDDGGYTRGTIMEVISPTEAKIDLFDIGAQEVFDKSLVFPLHKKFMDTPKFLLKVKLGGIFAPGGTDRWPDKSVAHFLGIMESLGSCRFFVTKTVSSISL